MKYKRSVSTAIAIIIFGGLFQLIDWPEAVDSFSSANFFLVMLGVSLTLFWPLIGAFRWQKVLQALGSQVSLAKALNAIMAAFSANLFAPAKSGDFIKILVTERTIGKKILASGVLAERMGDLLILGLFSFIGGMFFEHYLAAVIGFGVALSIITIIVIGTRLRWNIKWIWLRRVWDVAQSASEVWIRQCKKMLQAIFWSFANWGLAAIQIWLFYLAFGVNIYLITVFALFPLAVLISLFPITPGGIGVRESAFVLVFLPYAESHTSIAVSLGYFVCNSGLTALIGFAFFAIYKGKELSKINEIVNKELK